MTKNNKRALAIFGIWLAVILLLAAGAALRTGMYNRAERQLTLEGEALYNIPDYSALSVELTKEPGGWSAELGGVTCDAYTLTPRITNPTEEDLSDYRVRVDVLEDVYFLTAWCGTIEFHQGVASGNEKVQTIDLRSRPELYTLDTVETDEDPLIPLYAGDYFVYIPSQTDGEAPLPAGETCTPGIMYYQAADAGEVFAFVPSAPRAEAAEEGDVTAVLSARSSTWTKVFDLEETGSEVPDYQAYTYDLTITNRSGAELTDYTFRFSFRTEAYLASAWNGSVEICQGTVTETIPDLRSFDAASLTVTTVNVDGEDFIPLGEEDSFVYTPSASQTAREIPVEAGASSVPGFIAYLRIGDGLSSPSLTMEYQLHRSIGEDNLFKLALGAGAAFLLCLVIFLVLYLQRLRYERQHEHDAAIIRESIETFTGFIDAKDPYTNGHSRRVAEYARLLARHMGYKDEDLDRVYYIGLLHDCGKIGVADSILTKPGSLTDEEFEAIKSHTTKGRDILANFSSIPNVAEGAAYHHERYDGRGYPEGKKGEEIPEIARIICVADSFDAMNTDRCYRARLSREKILSELENNIGKQFDPKVAEIMLRLIRDNEILL